MAGFFLPIPAALLPPLGSDSLGEFLQRFSVFASGASCQRPRSNAQTCLNASQIKGMRNSPL